MKLRIQFHYSATVHVYPLILQGITIFVTAFLGRLLTILPLLTTSQSCLQNDVVLPC